MALISEKYRELQQELHKNPNYGVASLGYAKEVSEIVRHFGFTDMLDYGAGKGRLGEELKKQGHQTLTVAHYDPARPNWESTPHPSPFVSCIDVLEHIEPEFLDDVLDDLMRVTEKIGFFTVHCGPAAKVLADGRNAHLIQKAPRWWIQKILARFDILSFACEGAGCVFLVKCSSATR